mmetsp:Transcript_48974/g.147518  ORF Transcript_48974/g.147518 Transcript_48974/m.147518 type:complete len:84 (-) Transcript_48974:843-1094(-)
MWQDNCLIYSCSSVSCIFKAMKKAVESSVEVSFSKELETFIRIEKIVENWGAPIRLKKANFAVVTQRNNLIRAKFDAAMGFFP